MNQYAKRAVLHLNILFHKSATEISEPLYPDTDRSLHYVKSRPKPPRSSVCLFTYPSYNLDRGKLAKNLSTNKMSSEKADTVPGLGFKDKDKALESLKILEGRDPDYQKLAVKGLLGRAKRVLTLTKDETKLQNIKDAMKTFDSFIKEFEKLNKGRENRPYLPLLSVETLLPLRKEYNIEDEQAEEFLAAYKAVKGEYKNLRTVSSGEDKPTWDIIRNAALKKLLDVIDEKDPEMWDDDVPSKEHMELILWAYSPEASKIKKSQDKFVEKFGSAQKEEKKEKSEKDSKKSTKRKSESSSSNSDLSDDESPKKKSKK